MRRRTQQSVLIADEHRPNGDPFDALIVAAARLLDLPLITRDSEITRSTLVETIWQLDSAARRPDLYCAA